MRSADSLGKKEKRNLVSTKAAAYQFLSHERRTCDQRTVERMIQRAQLHPVYRGRAIKLSQAEVEFASGLYHRWGDKAIPVYNRDGTWWPTFITARMLGYTPQNVNYLARKGILHGSFSPSRRYVSHQSLQNYYPAATERFLGSIGCSWFLNQR